MKKLPLSLSYLVRLGPFTDVAREHDLRHQNEHEQHRAQELRAQRLEEVAVDGLSDAG